MQIQGWSALALLGLGGCIAGVGPNEVVTLPATVTVRVGDQVRMKNSVLTLTFTAVSSDSRCPMGALCIQAGEAVLELVLDNPLSAQPRPPAYQVTLKGEKPDTVAGLILQVKELDPPRRINQEIKPGEYVAKIAIRQLQYAPD